MAAVNETLTDGGHAFRLPLEIFLTAYRTQAIWSSMAKRGAMAAWAAIEEIS